MISKKSMRKEMLEKLSKIPRNLHVQNSAAIAGFLTDLSHWKDARLIAITISNPPEVDSRELIKTAWKQGKEIAVPKCDPKTKRMTFRKITSFDQLETVYFGLKEPIEAQTEQVHKQEIDLMLVPGLAFNKEGFRLGFGGGYYDRYLENFHSKTISLAFEVQLVQDITIENHDIPIHTLITENGVVKK